MSDFQQCADFVIDRLEGGSKLVVDSGGMTRYGISSKAHPELDIVNLTREGAIAIYQDHYWEPAGCELFRWPFNLVVFDSAVNQGVGTAISMFKKTENWGEMMMERVSRYVELADTNPDMARYLRGWLHRLVAVYRKAKEPC